MSYHKSITALTLITLLFVAAACNDDDPLAIGGVNAPITNSDGAIGDPAAPVSTPAPTGYTQKWGNKVNERLDKIERKTSCLKNCNGKATAKRKKGKKTKPTPKATATTQQTAAPAACTQCRVLSISRTGVVKTNACCEGCTSLQFGYLDVCDGITSQRIGKDGYKLDIGAYSRGCYLTNFKCSGVWGLVTLGSRNSSKGICTGTDYGNYGAKAFRYCKVGGGDSRKVIAELIE